VTGRGGRGNVRRWLTAAWVLAAIVLGNGFFDLYVSRGAREYLQQRAEFAAGPGPEPAIDDIMADARHEGLIAGAAWGLGVLALGLLTIRLADRGAGRGGTD
jgi:hypothetical protein